MTGRRQPVGDVALPVLLNDFDRRLRELEQQTSPVKFLLGSASASPLIGTFVRGRPVIVQGGTVVDSDSDGDHVAGLTFPRAFPNCLISVVATLGDGTQGNQGIWLTNYSLSGCFVTRGGGTLGWRFNWIAMGQ